jgi:hypothetical protein
MFNGYYITFFPSMHLFFQKSRLAYAHFALRRPPFTSKCPFVTKPLYFFGLMHIIDEVYDHDGDGPGKTLSSEPAQVESRQGKPGRITPEFSRRRLGLKRGRAAPVTGPQA